MTAILLDLPILDDALVALPFIDPLGDHLTIAARCGDCGWIGERRLYTSTARWQVAIACSLHTCMSPATPLRARPLPPVAGLDLAVS